MDKSEIVKGLFENTALYLTYDYNLRIRQETVECFTRGHTFHSVLDVPCGTGTISLPLLTCASKLTFIDISSNMAALAKKNIPVGSEHKVNVINEDFFKLNIPQDSYDLVICLGLLAHVNSPEQLLQKLSKIVAPGGYLIIQNTDSEHFYSKLIRAYLALKNLIKKQNYTLNKVPAKYVESRLEAKEFMLQKKFRYNQSFLGLSNFFSNEKKYSLTRVFFGTAENNTHAAWGSDITYLFKKISN